MRRDASIRDLILCCSLALLIQGIISGAQIPSTPPGQPGASAEPLIGICILSSKALLWQSHLSIPCGLYFGAEHPIHFIPLGFFGSWLEIPHCRHV